MRRAQKIRDLAIYYGVTSDVAELKLERIEREYGNPYGYCRECKAILTKANYTIGKCHNCGRDFDDPDGR